MSEGIYFFPGFKKFIPGIAWFFVVLVLVCTPGPDLPEVGDWFGEINADKLIHCGIFGLLALLFMWPAGRAAIQQKHKINWFKKIALCTGIWGFVTELLQLFFIPGRSFSLMDTTADLAGGLGALAFCYYYFIKKRPASA